MTKGPLDHVSALLPRRFVREAKVDPLPYPGVDHFLLQIRKLLWRRVSSAVGPGLVVVIEKLISLVPKKSESARVTEAVKLFAPEVWSG